MAQTYIIEVVVEDGEVKTLNQQLKVTEERMTDVEDSTKGVVKQTTKIVPAAKKAGAAMKAALIGTGIGIFLVALGLVVAFWDDIKGFATGVNVELERQIKLQQDIVDKEQHALDLLNLSKNVMKLQGKTQKEINDALQIQIEKLIDAQKIELQQQKDRLQGLIDIRKGGSAGLEGFFRIATALFTNLAQTIDKFFAKIGINTDFAGTTFRASDTVIEKIFGSNKDIEETEARVKALEKSLAGLANTAAGIILSEQEPAVRAAVEGVGSGLSPEGAVQLEQEKELGFQLIDLAATLAGARRDVAQSEADFERKLTKEVFNAKMQSLLLYARALSNIGDLLGRTSAEGKAAAIAAATINAFVGISNVWSEKSEAGFVGLGLAQRIAATAIVASLAFANVRRIMAVKVPGGGGGASRGTFALGSTGGGASIPAPEFNVVGDVGINQLNNTIGDQFGRPQRAFVVFGDIQTAQQLENESIEGSTV